MNTMNTIDSFDLSPLDIVELTAWNTQRLYSIDGQRIIAARWPTGVVVFKDIDRMIDGMLDDPWLGGPLDVDWVMNHYDHNRYIDATLNVRLNYTMRNMLRKL